MSFAQKVSVPVYFTLSSTWKRCLERKEAIKTLDVKSNFPFVSQKMQGTGNLEEEIRRLSKVIYPPIQLTFEFCHSPVPSLHGQFNFLQFHIEILPHKC